jgi:osmoprotectant transport system permease protein
VILGRSLGGSHDATLTALPGVDTTSDCYNFVNNSWFCPAYFVDRSDEIVSALQEHVLLTVVSVLLGTLLAFPLAVLARRSDLAAAVVLGISTIIYTIPSLAMFSLLLVVFYVFNLSGITRTNVVIGLALYSLTILVRNMLAGLNAVPSEVRDAGRGLGYGATRMLFRIELPLALPVIFAGLRVATVSTVALVTVGSILGYGGLGNLIREGYNTNFKAELFTGSVLCVLLAVAFDLLLLGVQRVSTPWQRR